MPIDPGKKKPPASDISIDDLEKLPEQPVKEKPVKADTNNAKKLSDEDKSKAFGMAATIVCIAGIAIFLFMQFLPGGGNLPSPQPSVTEPATEPSSADPVISQNTPQPGTSDAQINYDPYNRFPSVITDENGDEIPDRSEPAQGGTRYWVRDRDKDNMFKIVIPAGYQALDYGDSIGILKSDTDSSVTENDPLAFYWLSGNDTRALLQNGYYDYLTGTGSTGFSKYEMRAIGYYLFKDEDGAEWPVVTALLERTDDSDESGSWDYTEYRIIVGKPTKYNQYLSGSIPAYSFSSISSQAYPDITALAKALFPPSSEPDFPYEWSWYWNVDEDNPENDNTGWWDDDGNWHPGTYDSEYGHDDGYPADYDDNYDGYDY